MVGPRAALRSICRGENFTSETLVSKAPPFPFLSHDASESFSKNGSRVSPLTQHFKDNWPSLV